MDIETLRASYRPVTIRVLFVGESVPRGGTFFYAENSLLYKATKDGFLLSFPGLAQQHFLSAFRNWGCYLDDLCRHPVNHLDSLQRELEREKSLLGFTERLRTISPIVVVSVMKQISPYIQRALKSVGYTQVAFHELSFPRNENYGRYVAELKQLLCLLREQGLFESVLS